MVDTSRKHTKTKMGDFFFQDLPIIDTPFTRLTEHWGTHQHGPCADFELDYFRCAGRVGYRRATTECARYMDDFYECAFKIKQGERYYLMQQERKKQKRPFIERPPGDCHYTMN